MAIWYWDPVGGSNAADGTTFANRKLTLQSLTTATAGDTIRCIESPEPVNTAVNATWTDNSNTVTLASAVTQLVASCDTNWTASTNVTCATNAVRKEGTAAVIITIAAGFTTGKAAYFATGALDLSGYQQLTFWMKQTSGTLAVAGDYTISLCSDTIGAVPVNTFSVPAIGALTTWVPVTINLGTNLGASIQSIAFNVVVDRAAVVFSVDNINVAKAVASADALTVSSLISKNTGTEAWFGIRSISGTTVILDSAPQYILSYAGGVEPTYSGTTETASLWRRETLKTLQQSANTNFVNYYAGVTGVLGNPVTISGGWDATAMTTQSGKTYLDGSSGYGYGMAISGTNAILNYINFSNINACRYYAGYNTNISSNQLGTCSIIADDLNNNNLAGLFSNVSTIKNMTYTITNAVKNGIDTTTGYGIQLVSVQYKSTINAVNCNSNWTSGLLFGGSSASYYSISGNISITNINRNGNIGASFLGLVSSNIAITNAKYNIINVGTTPQGNIVFDQAFGETNGTHTVNSHDNILTIGSISRSSSGQGVAFVNGADNNKVVVTGGFTGFLSASDTCFSCDNCGSNYVTSSEAIFPTGVHWASVGGNSKLYISTADVTAPTSSVVTGSNASVIVKNAYGITGQNFVVPANSWGLS